MDKREREQILLAIDSPAFRALAETVVRRVNEWTAKLVEEPDLPEAQRRGLVYAIAALKEGIEGYFKQADLTLPPWLEKELYFYREYDE